MRLRAVSPLLAAVVLIAIVVSAGIVAHGVISGWVGMYGSTLSVQAASVDLIVALLLRAQTSPRMAEVVKDSLF